jgi:uncharacterized damage-inducible protein DinB
MADTNLPEVWLRGPVEGYDPLLLPVAHSLLQVREDVVRVAASIDPGRAWHHPGRAASIGFHIMHLAGSVDRLFTYARGETLSERQRAALAAEASAASVRPPLDRVVKEAIETIDRALEELKGVRPDSLLAARRVGRAGLPSTTLGLLFHAAEHATRHAGQAMTTARIVDVSPP